MLWIGTVFPRQYAFDATSASFCLRLQAILLMIVQIISLTVIWAELASSWLDSRSASRATATPAHPGAFFAGHDFCRQ
ncbi:hypothetical protein NKI77_13260 [Mesorhizobium opportunistum]|uniref:Uncharacterized protein n=1 Tax=Mesorhizobium opportunistum TaxID=593909 RepID=A0ABV1YKJ4_9HYPH|nr:hypothetical protein [Mesorhizobium sp.]TIN93444.1 MAG: hypothetical protein E5Y06_19545 [Mesorhizobium sp.]TJU96592.1 MAG: hypothetical protein E5Y08_21230 [Mesorhizobium sp.]TJV15739.1 MAG: hypothetical protein E5Y07_20710 [Mesorhizobium sp.]